MAKNKRRGGKKKQARLKHLMDSQNGRCHYCDIEIFTDVPPAQGNRATVDHKNPLKNGGVNALTNCVAACWRCNHLKASLTAEQFFKRYATRIEKRKALPPQYSIASQAQQIALRAVELGVDAGDDEC